MVTKEKIFLQIENIITLAIIKLFKTLNIQL